MLGWDGGGLGLNWIGRSSGGVGMILGYKSRMGYDDETTLSYHAVEYIISGRIVLYRIILYRIVSYCIVSYRIVSDCMVWYGMTWYCIASYRIRLYRIVSYDWVAC